MNILITGASGFLGTNLLHELLISTDYRIIAFSTRPDKLQGKHEDYSDRFKILSDIFEVDWSTVDVLLNLAFPRNKDGVQMANGLKFISDLFYAAAKGGVGAIINISSQSVYSQYRTEPATEETELNLESTYAVGKYAVELLLDRICDNIPHTNIRLASLIGVGFDQRITNKLIDQVLDGENLVLRGGEQRYCFLDVRDAVSGIISIINSNFEKWSNTYNLGSNSSYTLAEIADYICEINTSLGNKHVDCTIEKTDSYQNTCMKCDKFFEDMKWSAKYNLKDTLIWIFKIKQNQMISGEI